MSGTRYWIEERGLEPEESLAYYRATLAWAAGQATRFVLRLQRSRYDEPGDVAQLTGLGRATPLPEPPRGCMFPRLGRRPAEPDFLEVEGAPDDAFVRELTRKGAPPRAVAGDVCPVEDVDLFVGERNLYGSYDYGRTQVLDLEPDELEDLRQTLAAAGLDPDRLVPAPEPA